MIGRIAVSAPRQRIPRPPSSRWYNASVRTKRSSKTTKKDLPPPLPPRKSPLPQSSSKPNISPAEAKKEYFEARKNTGEFLRDPKAKIASLQADMDKTKEKLLKVHDKPIWKRIFDRFRAKQHAVINLLAASMAYILAHRLHLKMKANDELQLKVESETTKNSELRSLLRSLATEEFARDVVSRATTTTATATATSATTEAVNDKRKESGPSWFWPTKTATSSSSSLPREDALVASLRQKLEAAIGDDGLEDADRKQKHIQDVWEENVERIENTNEGLAELAAALAAEGSQTGTKNSKKRVFDM